MSQQRLTRSSWRFWKGKVICDDCGKEHKTGHKSCLKNATPVPAALKTDDLNTILEPVATVVPVQTETASSKPDFLITASEPVQTEPVSSKTDDSRATSEPISSEDDVPESTYVCPAGHCPKCPAPSEYNRKKKPTKLIGNYVKIGMCSNCSKQDQTRVPISEKLRNEVWDHYLGNIKYVTCLQCNLRTLCAGGSWHAAHIVAHVNGGTAAIDNLLPMCRECKLSNSSNTIPDEIVAKYQAFKSSRESPAPAVDTVGVRLTELNSQIGDISLSNAINIATNEVLWSAWKTAHESHPGREIYVAVSKTGSISFGPIV